MKRTAGSIVAMLVTAIAFMPAPARAAVGDLTFAGCIADAGMAGCTAPVAGALRPLQGAGGVAISPLGGSVYVVSYTAGSISHLRRQTDGSLSFAGCIANGGAHGCADPSPGDSPLGSPGDVAVSPDGTSVYVASPVDGTANGGIISHFRRADNGDLTFAGCIGNGAHGCTNPAGSGNTPFSGAAAVAVSPDGASVHVASKGADSVSAFRRADNGDLTFVQCVANTNAEGCTGLSNSTAGLTPLGGANAVTVAARGPDTFDVYVGSSFSNSVSHLIWYPLASSYFFDDCLANLGAGGCQAFVPAPNQPLSGINGVALAPGGNDLYVLGGSSGSVGHLPIAADGSLSFAGCLKDGGGDGCANSSPGLSLFNGASGLAVSGDGRSVYVAAGGFDTVSHLRRAPGGSLSFGGCVAGNGVNNCSNPSSLGNPLDDIADLAVSPAGTDLYITATATEGIAHMRREPVPPLPPSQPEEPAQPVAEPPVTPIDPHAADDTTPPQTTILRMRSMRGGTGVRFFFSADESATFSCSLDRRAFRACEPPKRYRRLRPGRHRFRVVAEDASGNVDPTAAVVRFRIRAPRR